MRPTQANALIHNHVTETYHILSGAGSIESRGCSKSIETVLGVGVEDTQLACRLRR